MLFVDSVVVFIQRVQQPEPPAVCTSERGPEKQKCICFVIATTFSPKKTLQWLKRKKEEKKAQYRTMLTSMKGIANFEDYFVLQALPVHLYLIVSILGCF